jgi:hypothetical protein
MARRLRQSTRVVEVMLVSTKRTMWTWACLLGGSVSNTQVVVATSMKRVIHGPPSRIRLSNATRRGHNVYGKGRSLTTMENQVVTVSVTRD